MADKKTFTDEQKAEILAKAEEIGAQAAAKEYGINWQTIRSWKQAAAKNAVASKAKKAVKKAEAEVKTAAAKAGKTVKSTVTKGKTAAKKAEADVKKAEKKIEAAAAEIEKDAKTVAAKGKNAAKKAETSVKSAAKKAEKKVEKVEAKTKAPRKKQTAAAEVIIQSPLGGIITPDEIRAKVGQVDKVYVRVDENKAYWVRGDETGAVDLW